MSELIAEGAFRARGVSASLGKSSKKETPCVTVTLRLEEGPDKGKLIDWIGWVGPNSKERTAESMVLMGFDGTDIETCTREDVVAVIEHETEEWTTKDGEPKTTIRPRVKWINDLTRGGAKFLSVDAAEKSQILSKLRGLALAAKEAHRKTAGAASPAASPAATSPEISGGAIPRF